jgi:hypothetical protein
MTLIKTDIFLSYLAGFFDGEGSVGIYSSNKQFNHACLRVQLKQNESKEIVEVF